MIRAIGFKDIFIFVDEADHLEQIDEFLRMLTRSREVLFTQNYTFFIAGSIQLAKYLESMGTVFDKVISVKPADWISFLSTLEKRLQQDNPNLKVGDIFEEKALKAIYNKSKGVRKTFLRLAQNILDQAAMEGSKKITLNHCNWVIDANRDEVTVFLKETQVRILKYLAQHPACSPSDKKFQKSIQLKRVQLRNNLEALLEAGYVHKEKKGRTTHYSLIAQYLPYFRE